VGVGGVGSWTTTCNDWKPKNSPHIFGELYATPRAPCTPEANSGSAGNSGVGVGGCCSVAALGFGVGGVGSGGGKVGGWGVTHSGGGHGWQREEPLKRPCAITLAGINAANIKPAIATRVVRKRMFGSSLRAVPSVPYNPDHRFLPSLPRFLIGPASPPRGMIVNIPKRSRSRPTPATPGVSDLPQGSAKARVGDIRAKL
jgi:hypothetical protein